MATLKPTTDSFARIPAPPSTPTGAADRNRRKHNVRTVAAGLALLILAALPATMWPAVDVAGLAALCSLLVCTGIALILNQRGATENAGLLLVASLTLIIMGDVVGTAYAHGGLDISQVRLLDQFVGPIVLSSITLSRRAAVLVASITSTFTCVALLALPRTPALQAYYHQHYPFTPGSAFDIFVFALGIQWAITFVSYVAASSSEAAVLYATRADDLYQAHKQIAAQAEQLARHKEHLADGIQRIQDTYASVMRGQWDVRVQCPDNELMPLALSFNRLLDRSARLIQAQEEHKRLVAAVQALEATLRCRRGEFAGYLPRRTGTVLDESLELLAEMRPSTHHAAAQRTDHPAPRGASPQGVRPPLPAAPAFEGEWRYDSRVTPRVTLVPLIEDTPPPATA